MMTTRKKGQSVSTRSKQEEDDDEPDSVKKEDNTPQKLSQRSELGTCMPNNHMILCSAVNKNYELRRSTRVCGVHTAAVRSASGKETRQEFKHV